VNDVYGAWSKTYIFTVDTISPDAPVLTSPANGSQKSGLPTFAWSRSIGAATYQFEYNTSDDPETYVYRSDEITKTSFTPASMDTMVWYYWYVRSKDTAGNWSAWSDPFTIMSIPQKPGQVKLTNPTSGTKTEETSPVLMWNAVNYGYTYEIEIDDSSNFSSPDYTYTSDVETAYYMAGPLDAGKWYWRVRAKNNNDVYGAWSSPLYFTVYSSFYTEFLTDGDFEGWEQLSGGNWYVDSGLLSTSGDIELYTHPDIYRGDATIKYDETEFSDFTFETRVFMEEPPGYTNPRLSFYIRSDDDRNNAISFNVSQENWYGTMQVFCYSIGQYIDGEYTFIKGNQIFEDFTYFNYGGWNIYKIIAVGNQIKIYINDVRVFNQQISGPVSGTLQIGYKTSSNEYYDYSIYIDYAKAGMPE